VAYSNARDWFRGVANTEPAAEDASYFTGGGTSAAKTSNTSPTTLKKSASGELPPAVVEEVVDWLKDEMNDRWLEDCVGEVAEPQEAETLELVDAGKKCTSVIGANGDYRSGMAREAVAYLLKSTLSANKAKSKKTLPGSNSNNSTAAPSTVGSACPTQRSEKLEASACPTQRSEKPEEDPPQSWRTALPCDAEPSEAERTWCTVTPQCHSPVQSPSSTNAPEACATAETPAPEKQNNGGTDSENSFQASTAQDVWGFAALAKGFESLTLPVIPSWSAAADRCGNLKIAHREVVQHASEPSPLPPVMLQEPVDTSLHGDDEWAVDHFSAVENIGQSLTADSETAGAPATCTTTAEDDCRSYLSSTFLYPPVPPLVFPSSDDQDCYAPVVRSETMHTSSTTSDSNSNSVRSEVETKGACDRATCVGISNDEDVCPNGHDLRWHSWRCAICDKHGSGLRFGCTECPEANLCINCKKANDTQKQVTQGSTSSKVHSKVQPAKAMSVITENQAAPSEAAPKSSKKSGNGSGNNSSSRRERPAGSTSKSVLSVQTMGTSSAAQLLGGLAQNQGNSNQVARPPVMEATAPKSSDGEGRSSSSSRRERPAGSASKSVLSVQTMGTSSAAQLLGDLAQKNSNGPRSNSSKKAFESKSVIGEAKTMQRRSGSVQRAGGSVLSVKNPSSSAAAGLLGPLLEQKAK